MRILMLDIELAPNLATVWSIWKQNIAINQLLDTSRMLCFAAKWYGHKKVIFQSEYHHGKEEMLETLYELLEEADAVCHYNGQRFDMPHINREFLEMGWEPPAPYHQIDLLQVVKKRFRFVSNKLDHIAQELGLGEKVKHRGHQLWLDCMEGKRTAWREMKEYNIQDIALLESLYVRILPWIQNHPNYALYTDDTRPCCPNCGGTHVVKKGVETTKTMTYQRYKCSECGTPVRGRTTILHNDKRKAVLIGSKL